MHKSFITNKNFKKFFHVNSTIKDVIKKYPVLISQYYFNLINSANFSDDPIGKQCIPSPEELTNIKNLPEDGLGEKSQTLSSCKIIRKYKDRIVLIVTNGCATHCRFCFRKHSWPNDYKHTHITDKEIAETVRYIKKHPEIKEVLISGGDPLTLSDERLNFILREINGKAGIDIIRIGTRIPVVLPERITDKLCNMLSKFPGLWIVTHFNHPLELTEQSASACGRLITNGIPVLNQSVLLKGVNDNAEILEELFRGLIKIRVKPYYLFHIDPVKGVEHFATGIECGLKILKQLRSSLSSLAIPTYAIDLPKGGGKIHLQPDYKKNGKFESLSGEYIEYPY